MSSAILQKCPRKSEAAAIMATKYGTLQNCDGRSENIVRTLHVSTWFCTIVESNSVDY